MLKDINSNNVSATDPDSVVNLINYYRNRKTSQLKMKNSPAVDSDPLKRHGVVCHILCPADGCNHPYVGMTTTKLSKWLAVHLQEGNFHQHYVRNHDALRRPLLLQSTTILDKDEDRRHLQLREALHIMHLKPTLNITQETFLLPTNIKRHQLINNKEPAAEGITVRAPASPANVKAAENPAAPNPPVRSEGQPGYDTLPLTIKQSGWRTAIGIKHRIGAQHRASHSRMCHIAAEIQPIIIQNGHQSRTFVSPLGL